MQSGSNRNTLLNVRKYLTMLVVTSAIVSLGLGSCVTYKRCYEKFPPSITIDTIIKDTIIYRDTTIYYQLPADTQFVDIPVYIEVSPDGTPEAFTLDTARAYTQYAEAEAWVERSRVKLELRQKDALIEIKLDSIIQLKNHYESLYIKEVSKEPPREKKIRFWDKLKFIGIGLLIGLVIGIVVRFVIGRR